MSKSDAQLEKERKQKEHRQKILKQHGGGKSSSSKGSHSKSSKKSELKKSAFQDLFQQRAQGFQIDFRFRNAPPRPPVGPTFVGNSLEAVLNEESRQYKPLNAVEVNYKWKLHSEVDLGVPLAPSAMDVKSYEKRKPGDENKAARPPLHPDDEALLDWKGSLGDTAADELKRRQQQARLKARLQLSGKATPDKLTAAALAATQSQRPNSSKKAFSRVLDEGMQTWMKKTTYLSNDYSRKVHDFKSLAQTKQELAQDLEAKQEEIAKRRSARAIDKSFEELDTIKLQHPMRKGLKPKTVLEVMPDVKNWGRTYTHLVIDKAPSLKPNHSIEGLNDAFVGNVEKRQANARMSCKVFIPANAADTDAADEKDEETDADRERYEAAQGYDLDVIPLKEEDNPHAHFCLWVDESKGIATYLPISSRVQLSTGRPARQGGVRLVRRRPLTQAETDEMEERAAEVNQDLAEKHHVQTHAYEVSGSKGDSVVAGGEGTDKADDGEGDFGDDDDSSDSGDEALFGSKTIIAEG